MISTMHDDGLIDESSGAEKKPKVITYYNSTKGGVDTLDELTGEYSVSRINCRWSMTIFFLPYEHCWNKWTNYFS